MTKKLFAFALTLLATMSAWAYDFKSGDLYYNITDEAARTVEVTEESSSVYYNYSSLSGAVTIPETVSYNGTTYSVTSIGGEAFHDCSALTQVTIGNSVTSIGNYAFWYCSALTQVNIPDGVKSIGDCAFSSCSALTQITIPDGVTSIGNSAFSDCSALTQITIPSSVESIRYHAFYNTALYKNAANWTNNVLYIDNCLIEARGLSGNYEIVAGTRVIADDAFYNCSALTQVTMPESMKNIGNYAFWYCSALTQVNIPDGVKSIGNSAFSSCSALTQVNIPDGVTSIGDEAFWYCEALTQVTIGNGVTSIGSSAFYGTALYKNTANWTNNVLYIDNCLIKAEIELSGNYEIVAGTRVIADNAFYDCSALTQVNIPNSVTSIGDEAFYYCSALTQVTIPNSVTSIGDEAFYYCKKLTQINVNTANTAYCSENGVLFNKDKTMLMQYPAGKPETVYAIPNGVTSIGSSAFSGCTALTQVTIPNSVTSIGGSVFLWCSALTQVTWNATNCADLASSDYSPFKSCPITDFTFGDQVKHIPAYLCYGMGKLTKVTIPNSVTSIGEEAFSDCSVLAEMTVLATVPPTITAKTFYKINLQVKVSIPEGSKDAYMADENWKWLLELSAGQLSGTCGDNLTWTFTTADSTLTISGTGDMYNYNYPSDQPWYNFNQDIKNISIQNGVTSIGERAFSDCSKLTQVTMPESVTSIESSAFQDCDALTAVYYTGDVAGWCGITFDGYDSNPLYYAHNLYIGNTLVTRLNIPDGITEIKDHAFARCSALTQVNIGNNVTSIGDWAFAWCSALTQVNIPDGVTSIGYEAFYGTALYDNADNWTNNVLYIDNCLIRAKEELSGNYEITADTRIIAGGAFSYCSALTQVNIPSSVTSIGNSAFSYCSALTQVNIPSSVTSIGNSAFYECSAFTQVTIGSGVTSIGDEAFSDCSALTQVTIPNSVTSIGEQAFAYCYALTQVTIGNSVTSIGYMAFYGCSALAEMTVLPTVPPTVGVDAFYNVSRSIPVYVPAESLEYYQVAYTWGEFNLHAMQTGLQTPSMPESIRVYGGTLHNPQQLPVSLYDMQGRMVYSGTAATVSQPAGVYVLLCAGASSKVLF